MSGKIEVNVLDMEERLSLKSTNSPKVDYQGFFRGVLDEVNLIEVDYSEDIAVNFNKDRTEDQGKKVQLDFRFKLFTEKEDKPLLKSIRTGTTFSKQLISQKYKSRGNKVMKSVFNKFTDTCLALGFVQPYQLQENDSLLLDKVEEIIKDYNKRNQDDKILIAGCFIQGEEKLIMDWFNMVYVETIDYEHEDICERLESLKKQKNDYLPTKTASKTQEAPKKVKSLDTVKNSDSAKA